MYNKAYHKHVALEKLREIVDEYKNRWHVDPLQYVTLNEIGELWLEAKLNTPNSSDRQTTERTLDRMTETIDLIAMQKGIVL